MTINCKILTVNIFCYLMIFDTKFVKFCAFQRLPVKRTGKENLSFNIEDEEIKGSPLDKLVRCLT